MSLVCGNILDAEYRERVREKETSLTNERQILSSIEMGNIIEQVLEGKQ